MNISSMSSTQSLWKFQMQVGSAPASAPSSPKASGIDKAAEELLSVLGQTPRGASAGASETAAPAESTRPAVPPLDLSGGRIALGLTASSSYDSNSFQFSKEDLTALKQKIEKSGQAMSDGLSKLIDQFATTD
ncbi:MAG TPA: hypothetical protein PKO06_23780, partial [Candidatus Ozemobacteraceae bacterium]|nr:hypothetical protein [Candidatus Ozemobacteraceae bacterium]